MSAPRNVRPAENDLLTEIGLIAYQLRGEFTLLNMVVSRMLTPTMGLTIPKAIMGQFLHVDDGEVVALQYVLSRMEESAWELERAVDQGEAA